MLLIVVTLWLLTVAVFLLTNLVPGSVGRTLLGPQATDEAVARLNEELGADRPVLLRYGQFIGDLTTGDLGRSVTLDTPIGPLVLGRLLNSLKLGGFAFVVVVPLSVLGGLVAGLRRGSVIDRVLSIVGSAGLAIPEFVSGVIVIYVFGVVLDILPVSAASPPGSGLIETLRHFILPTIPILIVLFAYLSRLVRTSVIDVVRSDYTRTAVLNGLPRRTVVYRHVLRNSLLPAVTVMGAQVAYLIGGLVVIESLFNYSGLGSLLVYAAAVQDVQLLAVVAVAIGVVVMLANLAADLSYGVLDPRVGRAGSV